MTQGGIALGSTAVPQAAIDLVKRFEGFHRVPHSDPLRRAHPYVCPVLLNQPENRLAAMVDFTFNLGAGRLQTSTLRRHLSEIESSKRDPRLSSIERIADAMELAVAGARTHGT